MGTIYSASLTCLLLSKLCFKDENIFFFRPLSCYS
uniref:Uncharacterized protein n=1 Tax=Rhizophora mucronata TaxID=61149 RepID=A0A2P2KSY2_RHIMU